MTPRISSAEWEVMSVVWDSAPVTATEVFEALPADRGWKQKTVNTFLARRGEIVDRIDQLLNCQKKPLEYQQDATLLMHSFLGCFFLGRNWLILIWQRQLRIAATAKKIID